MKEGSADEKKHKRVVKFIERRMVVSRAAGAGEWGVRADWGQNFSWEKMEKALETIDSGNGYTAL